MIYTQSPYYLSSFPVVQENQHTVVVFSSLQLLVWCTLLQNLLLIMGTFIVGCFCLVRTDFIPFTLFIQDFNLGWQRGKLLKC